MSNKRTKWTEKEDDILIQSIKDNPENIHSGLLLASTKTGRTLSAARNRYYNILSNPSHPNYRGTIFTLISHKAFSNTKNVPNYSNNSTVKSVSLWSKFRKFLRHIL